MRRFDKKKNIEKVNLLNEQIYLQRKGILVEGYHNEYEKYEPIMYIGEPITFSNGKTVKYGDIGEYIGTEGGEECWVAFPATGFATTFSNIKKIDARDSEIEEGLFNNIKDKLKNTTNKILDIPSKEDEMNKKIAIGEIQNFNFESLFYQPSNDDTNIDPRIAELKVADAAKAMPTVKLLNPILFELRGGYFSHASLEINGTLHKGVIPSCFEPIRGVNDVIDNEEAKSRMISFLG